MSVLESILVATDFSDLADQATARALAIAQAQGCQRVVLLHVVEHGMMENLLHLLSPENADPGRIEQALERELRQRAERYQQLTGIQVVPLLREGRVDQQIQAVADEHGCGLVVLGAHGKSNLKVLILGSTTERVIQNAARDVLVVRLERTQRYRNLLVPVDFSIYSQRAVRHACALADQGRVTVLHAFDIPFAGRMQVLGVDSQLLAKLQQAAQQEAEQKLQAFMSGFTPGENLSSLLVQGEPAAQIVRFIEAQRPELIVVGKQGRSQLEAWLLGSVTSHILALAQADVLVVADCGQ